MAAVTEDRRSYPVCGREFDGKRCRKRGEHMCEPRVGHVTAFFRELLVHTKGDWSGKPFILAGWELRRVIRPLFGTVTYDAGWGKYVRRYRELYLSTGRKNGKTEIIAGCVLYLLIGDSEQAGEIYGLALDKDQASLAYRAATRMVELSPALQRRLVIAKGAKRIADERTASFFAVAAGDAMGSLGASPSGAYIDELLTQPSRDLYDAITTGFGARSQPILILATTADNDPSGFAASEREWSERVAEDGSLDYRRLVVIYAAPPEADWTRRETWALANPALGDYLDPTVLADECAKAQHNPAAERAFRQFRLNQQSAPAGRAIDLGAWDASAGAVDLAQLHAADCYAGLDLASTSDLASYCLDFPADDGSHDVLWRVFAPDSAMSELDRRTGGRASVWAARGLLTVTAGNVIDYEAIKHALREDAERYDIRAVAFDRWGATQLSSELIDEGFPLIQVGQGFASMSGPTKELLRLVAAGLYRHGGNPLVRWQAGNLVTSTDPAGNLKPNKAKSYEKIDSIVAAVMALDQALRRAPVADDYAAAGW